MTDTKQETTANLRGWLLQDKHLQKAKQLREELEKAFTEHPRLTGENYFQHLWFTFKVSLRFVLVSIVLITHGLFPFLFKRATSDQIERVYFIMKSRVPRPVIKSSLSKIFNLAKNAADAAQPQRIGIIGGGFSGTMALANLIKSAEAPLIIEWFDESKELATGVAYSTQDSSHLLNVRADRMGAFAGKPEGFYSWLQTEAGKLHATTYWPDKEIKEDSFVPRVLYSAYLKAILDETLERAQNKGIEVLISNLSVVDANYSKETKQLMLSTSKNGIEKNVLTDALILATGNLPPRQFAFQPGLIRSKTHYVANVWQPGTENIFPERVNQLSADDEIVIIGTGLTMVDSVLTLKKNGYKGTITAISRHGWLPAAHAPAKPYSKWEWTLDPNMAPQSVLQMFKRLRQEIERAIASGYDWRSVIDSLRPVTQPLWKRLSTTEKRKFIVRLFTLWNIHRHRMAPEIHVQLKEMQQSGALKVIPGRIYYVGSDEQGLTVAYRKRGANRVETVRATLVLNCTGPEYDIATSSHRLLKNLRDRRLVSVDSLRMGISTTKSGSAEGRAPDVIFPIGTLLVGELLECTAVPELREQVNTVAAALTERLKVLRDADAELLGAWI